MHHELLGKLTAVSKRERTRKNTNIIREVMKETINEAVKELEENMFCNINKRFIEVEEKNRENKLIS